ncbi:MAG: M20 family metallopeptidase [Chloroflexi bacterium]|nr:M20 family metallopeptidase [Chloroflexota bacterium]
MVAIESVNPFYADGARGEVAMADYLEASFRALGLMPSRRDVLPGRPNVWAKLDAPGAIQTLLLEAHMDTVTLEPAGTTMLDPRIDGGRMYGRGSCDTKASLAAMLTAVEALAPRRDSLRANLVVMGSMDEEYLMRGILDFAAHGPEVHAAVIGEPTSMSVVRAHKGLVRWRVATLGRSAHTSRPEVGDNAIYQMVGAIARLRSAIEPRLATRTHALLSNATLTVSMIEGGLGANIVPDRCEITIDRRTLPQEEPDEVIAEFRAVIERIMRDDPSIKIDVPEPFANIAGLDTPADAPFVRLTTPIAHEFGGSPMAVGVPYGTNAPGIARRGVPTIVLGPGDIAQAHSANEWVELAQVERAAEMYARIAQAFPGR